MGGEQRGLSRFEKMMQVTVWTNRLDRRLNLCLAELKGALAEVTQQLEELQAGDSRAAAAARRCRAIYQEVLPEVIELCVVAADHVYSVDSRAKEFREQLNNLNRKLQQYELESEWLKQSRAFRIGHMIAEPFRLARDILTTASHSPAAPAAPCEQPPAGAAANSEREPEIDIQPDGSFNPYAGVDNSGSAFSLFDNWNTVFHFEGKRRGSKKPVVVDHLENLIALHSYFPLQGKRVLELGPFEAGHTKEMLDLGASEVTAVEANREAFLKCLVVKNEFNLEKARFIFGDFNQVMKEHLLARPGSFDLCLASGVLYHMEDPLYTIDLITRSAPAAFVWSQVAGEFSPQGEWFEIEDGEGRKYRARRNVYPRQDHWGGIGRSAVWLSEADLPRAFGDRGFEISHLEGMNNAAGRALAFFAQRS